MHVGNELMGECPQRAPKFSYFFQNSILFLSRPGEQREGLMAVARVWFCGVAQISLIQEPPSHKILTVGQKPHHHGFTQI